MAVDTARRDDMALGVDLSAAGADFRADRRDAAVGPSDVGAEDVGRGRERSVAYDQIVFGHDACASRSDRRDIGVIHALQAFRRTAAGPRAGAQVSCNAESHALRVLLGDGEPTAVGAFP